MVNGRDVFFPNIFLQQLYFYKVYFVFQTEPWRVAWSLALLLSLAFYHKNGFHAVSRRKWHIWAMSWFRILSHSQIIASSELVSDGIRVFLEPIFSEEEKIFELLPVKIWLFYFDMLKVILTMDSKEISDWKKYQFLGHEIFSQTIHQFKFNILYNVTPIHSKSEKNGRVYFSGKKNLACVNGNKKNSRQIYINHENASNFVVK